jgi:hypothetical protein
VKKYIYVPKKKEIQIFSSIICQVFLCVCVLVMGEIILPGLVLQSLDREVRRYIILKITFIKSVFLLPRRPGRPHWHATGRLFNGPLVVTDRQLHLSDASQLILIRIVHCIENGRHGAISDAGGMGKQWVGFIPRFWLANGHFDTGREEE